MLTDPYGYTTRKGIYPISWRDFHGICKALAKTASHFAPEIVLAIGRGGYYAGALIAHMLQTEIYTVRVSRRVKDIIKYKNPQWLAEPPPHVQGQRVLIVDEICSSGETISMVKERVEAMGATEVKSAVLRAHLGRICAGLHRLDYRRLGAQSVGPRSLERGGLSIPF